MNSTILDGNINDLCYINESIFPCAKTSFVMSALGVHECMSATVARTSTAVVIKAVATQKKESSHNKAKISHCKCSEIVALHVCSDLGRRRDERKHHGVKTRGYHVGIRME